MIDYIVDLYRKPRYQLTTTDEFVMTIIAMLIVIVVSLVTIIIKSAIEGRHKDAYWR